MKVQISAVSGHVRALVVGLVLALTLTLTFSSQRTWAQTEPTEAVKSKIYLAMISSESAVVSSSCQTVQQATEFANLFSTDPNQKRASLNCNQALSDVAQARAQDMADRAYFSHVTPDGYGPNYFVRNAGYTLPSFYDQANDGNNIESIAAGYTTAAEAWTALKNSGGHRRHLLGEDSFYAEQVDYGIGYVYSPNSPYKHYWVIITAKQASASE